MTELLAPAGDFECAKQALYNGADAIYCASEHFGARAYAKNLTIEELSKLLELAHSLNKKIYVTVNTILKDNEVSECIQYVNKLYELGVDGLILADFAIINYVIDNLPGMEAHISTQCGVKDLMDVRFFESINAKRVVLARENSFEEIKYIKENSNMPIEVFAHGALCVSYSGGCLMSSMLTLRSGNRGRCSQNCRREYTLYKDDTILKEKSLLLSMKDLKTYDNLDKLIHINVDSLKLEGRMKNPDYVKIITSEYRKKIDNNLYSSDLLESVFHRQFTKGFIFNEDKGNIVDSSIRHREGEYIGDIISKDGSFTKVKLIKSLNIKDRVRIQDDTNPDYYFSIDKIYDVNKKEINNGNNIIYLNIFKNFKNGKIYKMVDSSIDTKIDNSFKYGLTLEVFGKNGTPLSIKCKFNNKTYISKSTLNLSEALNKPLDTDTLIKQLSKLNDTSFYLKELINNLEGNVFTTISTLNETRRLLIENIINDVKNERTLPNINNNINKINYEIEPLTITAFCTNDEQYETLKSLGIKNIYYKNYIPYVEAKYSGDFSNILAGNYGALYYYKDKEITADYSFNAINASAIYNLHRYGAKYVTLSLEASLSDIKSIYEEYKKYGNNPNLEIIVYGRQNLMTTKYCPLKALGQCGQCNNHSYYLKDDIAKFPIYHVGCITHILNDKPLNLIDDLSEILKYTSRIRLSFTTESKDEIINIVNNYKEKLNSLDKKTNYFDNKHNTRGYYKRNII